MGNKSTKVAIGTRLLSDRKHIYELRKVGLNTIEVYFISGKLDNKSVCGKPATCTDCEGCGNREIILIFSKSAYSPIRWLYTGGNTLCKSENTETLVSNINKLALGDALIY